MNKEKILVVEDELLIAEEIAHQLGEFGYHVCGPVPSGEKAIELAKKEQPALLLTDINLGRGMDGIETATEIKKILNIPVVYVTAHSDSKTLTQAEITEPYGYVLKPFRELELRTALRLALYKAKTQRETNTSSQELENDSGEALPQSPEQAEILSFLKSIPELESCNSKTLMLLTKKSRFQEYSAGNLLIYEGDDNNSGFIVHSGRIALVKSSITGKEFIVELLSPKDVFSLAVTIAWQPYPVTAKVQVPSRVLWVPKACIEAAVDSDSVFSKRIIKDVFDRLRDAHNVARGLAHDKVDVRVATAILALLPRFSSNDGVSETSNTIQITRRELADCIGSAPETVVRSTRALEEARLLDLSKRGCIRIIDTEGLREIADGNL